MSAYRFCRTDDIALLVDSWNRCYLPHDRAAPPLTVAEFKQEIRELDLWCSSCMVGFEGDDVIAVVHGCKRPPYTLVRRIAVHPDHLRKGHGRHLLTSLSAKLAILGPPRLVAELPAENVAARELFSACGWRAEGTYTGGGLDGDGAPLPQGAIVPITLDDVPEALPAEDAPVAWECMAATLRKRAERMKGLAVLSAERIEASVFYTLDGGAASIWSAAGASVAALAREIVRVEGAGVTRRAVRPLVRYASEARSS